MNEDNKKPLNPKREALILLSNQAKELRLTKVQTSSSIELALYWESQTLNSIMLKFLYQIDGATEFNTFQQWKRLGATVKKHEKAFAVWGQPIRPKVKPEDGQEQEETDEYRYFPMCFLFSDKQVILPAQRITAPVEPAILPQQTEMIILDNLM